MLQKLRVASPCRADWERMVGDDRVRYCAECNLNVYNFSSMTAAELERLVLSHEGRLCGRMFRRTDGTVLTRDCPVGFRQAIRRMSRIAGAALSAALSLSTASAQTRPEETSSLVQIQSDKAEIDVIVADPTGALIPNARVSLASRADQSKFEGGTDSHGSVRFTNLVAGPYSLSVVSPGFRTANQEVNVLHSDRLNVAFTMELGAMMGEVVMVDGVVPVSVNVEIPKTFPEPSSPESIPSNPSQPPKHSLLKKLVSPFRH